ncbi:MAG: OsmC family protein [Candidatus Marinimicrobia bacterium]|jgi:putative redox protein|nr:OsmC family protein [Candidatus Neomarinimicrobiota bacterium]MBT4361534.1 OsmC family protein [Candidatus Neomarinimicrobiota bacterium]MBT4716013.1 OsmC family protein [Candidatus Neomarinimicrobiota bacterium]MBT4945904.1 OsmC family protein [Candidatus Neomarinimicrobiota bacterium]MBT5268009.1 OsmC family protein [Candidatus Neomarinimicrobiota bacterium]
MSEIKIQQLKGVSFAARGQSGHLVMMDGAEKVGGLNGASRPMEMVLFGLGGCTAIDVEVILKKMRVPVENIEIDIDSERADNHPKVYTKINMTYHFYGKNLPLKKLEKAVKLSKDSYCSVSAMLASTAEITATIEIHNTV